MTVEQLLWILITLSGLTLLVLAAFIIIHTSDSKTNTDVNLINRMDQLSHDNRLLLERFTEKKAS
jgi:hypothetical protein